LQKKTKIVRSTLESILNEFLELKGQFVITQSWKIERLVAIGHDQQDYYYVTYDGHKLTWNTCVGRVMRLKGKLDETDYHELIRIARLNHWDQVVGSHDFVRDHIKSLLALPESHQLITELFLNLN
jgi:hypothetical protein